MLFRNACLALLLALALPLAAEDLASFERKAEMNPKDAQAQFNLGVMAFRSRKMGLAESALAKAVKLQPGDAEAWELYGAVLSAQGKGADALKAFQKVTSLDGKRATAWMQQAKLLADSDEPGRLEEAAEAYERAGRLMDGDGRPWLNQGLLLARLGKDDRALDAFEKAAKLKGGEAAYAGLCVLYNKREDYKRALGACEKAGKSTGRAEDWYNLGFAQQRSGKNAEARRSLQAALKADPGHAPSLYNMAFLDFEGGQAEKALKGFQAALKARGGDYPEAQYNAAVLLGDLGRYEEAAELYRKLLKRQPDNADARSNLDTVVEAGVGALIDQGKDAYERGDFKAAQAAWQRAKKLDPENDQAASLLKTVAKKAGKSEKAAQAARQAASKAVAKKLKDEDSKVLKQGLAALKAGKQGEGIRLLDFYLKKNPGDQGARTALFKARAQVRQASDELLQSAGRELVAGRREAAHSLAQKALDLDPNNARARKLLEQSGKAAAAVDMAGVRKLYYAGVEQYLQGDLAAAVKTWNQVLAQDPQHLDAKRSLTRAQLELAALKKRGK
jgi:tetratricopeptide (TPR) repeat protein